MPDATSLQTSSQLPLPSGKNIYFLNYAHCNNQTHATLSTLPSCFLYVPVTPPSTSIPIRLVIAVSVGAGVPLLCLALMCSICVVVLCVRLKKSPYKMENPLYGTTSPHNALPLSLEPTGSTIIEAPLFEKNENGDSDF